MTNLTDARTRLLLAIEDHSRGMTRLSLYAEKGMLTPEDFEDRAKFLNDRLHLARVDFARTHRPRHTL